MINEVFQDLADVAAYHARRLRSVSPTRIFKRAGLTGAGRNQGGRRLGGRRNIFLTDADRSQGRCNGYDKHRSGEIAGGLHVGSESPAGT